MVSVGACTFASMTSGVVTQLAEDAALTAVELVEVLAHCRSVTASADYRMLQAASLIHEEREEDFLAEVAEEHSGEATTSEQFGEMSAAARAKQDPRSQFGPDGLERAMAEVGAVLNVTPGRARELIVAGSALRHRLPFTGHALATGRLDLGHFLIAVSRTALCSPETIADVDAHLAQAIFARPPMARARFTVMVDAVVAQFDPDALLRRRERAEADRKVSVRPDRHAPGQSRLSASLPMASAAEIDAQLEAMAAQPHTADPRTRDQRRADALLAMSRHESRLECRCADCTAAIVDTAGDAASKKVRPTFHIVANLSTLVGLDDDPGFLDGHGIVDADTMRSLLADARREFLRPTPPAADATGYVPSRKLQALIRAGELCCTFPGCSAPAWSADIDHTDPFDHRHPGRGGSTVRANLKPLCRFHHRIKTFTAWRDHQDEMGTVLFESPTGHMFLGNAYTGTDLFSALRSPPSRADHPARRHLDELRIRQRDAHRRAVERAQDAEPPPPY